MTQAVYTLEKLKKIFNKFANREVLVTRLDTIAPQDTVIADLREMVKGMKLNLLLVLEGNRTPQSLPGGTVPVFVKKDLDQKYRIDQVGIGAMSFKR